MNVYLYHTRVRSFNKGSGLRNRAYVGAVKMFFFPIRGVIVFQINTLTRELNYLDMTK